MVWKRRLYDRRNKRGLDLIVELIAIKLIEGTKIDQESDVLKLYTFCRCRSTFL